MLRLKPLLRQLTITTKKLEEKPLDLDYIDPRDGDFAWAQRLYVQEIENQYNQGRPVRIVVLKARQLGISTATGGVVYWWGFLHNGSNGLIATHESDQSEELFGKIQHYWDTFPYKELFTPKYSTKQHIQWIETNSKLRVATAKNVKSGRGSTLHAVHLSEVAFYPDPKTFLLGLNQTVPNRHKTMIVLESTANGVGNYFYDFWNEAMEGGNDYVPLFFPWWRHSEYRIPTTLTIKSELDADEKHLLRIMDESRLLSTSDIYEAIAWRRWAIKNLAAGNLDDFMQEYPSTPEEAFITSGRPIFSHMKLKEVYVPANGHRGYLIEEPNGRMRFVSDPSGNLTIFKAPRRGDKRQDRYFVAGDPSESIAGDPSCIQVINRGTFEQVAVWHGRVNPIVFGDEMVRVGKYYNNAMLCPEAEGGGQATVARIITLGYPSIWQHRNPDRITASFNTFGWATNFSRKSWAVGTLQRLIIDNSITIHDRITYEQLRNFVQRDDGTMGNADASVHDDSVMALAIGVTASISEGPFTADGGRTHTIADLYNQEYGNDAEYVS
jgi:hypothetical protein